MVVFSVQLVSTIVDQVYRLDQDIDCRLRLQRSREGVSDLRECGNVVVKLYLTRRHQMQ